MLEWEDSGTFDDHEPSDSQPEYPTEAAARIMTGWFPLWRSHFLKRHGKYKDIHKDLGVKGQIVDIHRKELLLKAALWDEVDTSDWGEQPREIVMDLIGHLFLTLDLLDQEESIWEAKSKSPTITPQK